MKLKNYTSSVPADRTIGEIERILAEFGANAIMKNMLSDGRITSLAFQMNGNAYKLPINTEGVYKTLFGESRTSHRVNAVKNREDQAYRTAWRIIKDWIHSQLSLIQSGQAQPDEILLPYAFDGKQTLYQAYKDGRLQLGEKR